MKLASLKIIFFFIIFFLNFSLVRADESTLYEQLCEVNSEWKGKYQIEAFYAKPFLFKNDDERIRTHLILVEQKLREASTDHLSPKLKSERLKNINRLNAYWKAGIFPKNSNINFRIPFFMNGTERVCAVGYLVVQSGGMGLAKKISSNMNNGYIRELNNYFPELTQWAENSGLTLDELAWIQPGYPGITRWGSCKGSTNGDVYTLKADTINNLLYVGGSFTEAGGMTNVNNIAVWNGTDWTKLASGVNGPVHASVIHQDKLYIAGQFSITGSLQPYNIAKWTGTIWELVGSGFNGKIHTLVSNNNKLYIGGAFTNNGNRIVSLSGTTWNTFSSGVNDTVYTIAFHNNDLYIGGSFTQPVINGNNISHISKWSAIDGWDNLGTGLESKVRCLASHNNKLYAGGDFNRPNSDTLFGFANWNGSNWTRLRKTVIGTSPNLDLFIHSITPKNNDLELVGKLEMNYVFDASMGSCGMITYDGNNFFTWRNTCPYVSSSGRFDKPIYASITFQNKSYIGGEIEIKTIPLTTSIPGYTIYAPLGGFAVCNPSPVISPISESWLINPPSEITYSVSNHIGSIYNWTITGAATITSGQGTDSVTVAGPSGIYTIRATETNSSGSSFYSLRNIIINNNPPTTSNISGPSSVSLNQNNVTYSVSYHSGSSYTWTIPAGATISTGQGTILIKVNFGTSGGNIEVIETNPSGSGLPVSITIAVGTPHVTSAITGSTIVNANQTGVIYNVTNHSGSTYAWTIPSDATVVSGQGSNTITVNFGTSGGNIEVTESNQFGPGTPVSISVAIDFSPVTSTITGSTTVNTNQTGVIYYVTNNSGSTYAWTIPSDATVVSGQGSNTITVNFGTSGGNIEVTESNSFGSGIPVNITVAVGTPPVTSTITGSTIVNANQTGVVYSVTNNLESTYTWTVPSDASVVSGQGSNTITADFGILGGSIEVTESNQFGAGSPESITITVNSSGPNGIIDSKKARIVCYPNPAQNKIFLFSDGLNTAITFNLFNLQGTVLKSINFDPQSAIEIEIEIADLPNGMYFYKISEKDEYIDFGKIIIEQ